MMLGKSEPNIFFQLVVCSGLLQWYKVKNHAKQIQVYCQGKFVHNTLCFLHLERKNNFAKKTTPDPKKQNPRRCDPVFPAKL